MNAHTPGPWSYGVRRDGSIWLSLGDHKTGGTHYKGYLVATPADARLIAAAPELLAACRRSVCALAFAAETNNAFDADYEFVSEVISKATRSLS